MRIRGVWASVIVLGCDPAVDELPGSSSTGPASSGAQTASPASTAPGGTTTSTSSAEVSTGVPEPDSTGGGSVSGVASSTTSVVVPEDCDVFAQDCPPGYKCAPFSNDGGSGWNDTTCVPVVDDPAGIGEPCTAVDSGVSGLDDCGVGQMCWDLDPRTLQGECIELCGGSPEAPQCLQQPQAMCIISASGVLAPCFVPCDPLGEDCDAGELCVPAGAAFFCAPDAAPQTGALGEPCEFVNVCDPGLGCFAPVEGLCDEPLGFGCCLPYCSLAGPECPSGLQCQPWWEAGEAPAGFEDVGVCHVTP